MGIVYVKNLEKLSNSNKKNTNRKRSENESKNVHHFNTLQLTLSYTFRFPFPPSHPQKLQKRTSKDVYNLMTIHEKNGKDQYDSGI